MSDATLDASLHALGRRVERCNRSGEALERDLAMLAAAGR
jgi:hypothetical protein